MGVSRRKFLFVRHRLENRIEQVRKFQRVSLRNVVIVEIYRHPILQTRRNIRCRTFPRAGE